MISTNWTSSPMINDRIQFRRIIPCALSLTLLGACGGGDGGTEGDGGTGNSPTVQTGVLIDGPVQGVRYQTATQTGSTNANGQFNYLANETVAFSIGGIQLGSATAASQIDPFDLAGIAPPSTEAELRTALGDTSFTAFDRAINIALLLMSLDNDHDPDNGLDVTGWDAALAGASLDFNSDWHDFRDHAFNQFAHAYQVSSSVSPTVLLTHLYGSLNITATTSILSSSETNQSTGATLDAIIDAATDYIYEFDSSGNVLKVTQTIDSNADGTVDSRSITAYTYDAAGKMSTKAQGSDADADGGIDEMGTTTTYDAGGNVLSEIGWIISWLKYSWTLTYAENGDLTTEFVDYEVTSSGSGYSTGAHPISVLTTYSYDAAGNQVAAAHEYTICGFTPPANCTTYYYTDSFTYDANGNLLTAEKSTYSAGSLISYTETHSYDANNNLLGSVIPTWYYPDPTNPINAIVVDTTTTYTYDANGKLVSKVAENPYLGERTTTTYDGSGNELTRLAEQDPDTNGTVDSRDTYTYTYDANGNRLAELHQSDTNADGVIDNSTQVQNTYTQINNGLTYLFQEFGGQL